MTILVNVNIQFVDESGKPFAAGLYYFGDPDVDPVTNPKAVFSDPALSIELPNPQVLDARGAFQQPIYRPSSDYSHKLDDVLVNQIFLVANDSAATSTASNRVQDNVNDTTILDEGGNPGLILTTLNIDPDSIATQLLHNNDVFLQGDDDDTTLFDSSGNVVFNATINPSDLTTIGVNGNLTPIRITVDDTKIFAPGAGGAAFSLEITSGQTNFGTDGNLNAIEITDSRVRVVAATDNGIAFESIAGTTKLGTAAHPNAFVINQTEVIIRNPLSSGTEAIRVIDGETTISANTNVDAIKVTTADMNFGVTGNTSAIFIASNQVTIDTSDTLTLGGQTSVNITASTNVNAIRITSGSTLISAPDDNQAFLASNGGTNISGGSNLDAIVILNSSVTIATNGGLSLTAETGNFNLTSTLGTGTVQCNGLMAISSTTSSTSILAQTSVNITSTASLITLNATTSNINCNVNTFLEVDSAETVIGEAPVRIEKSSVSNANLDLMMKFDRNNGATDCGGIEINNLSQPSFQNPSDRRLKLNYAPVENMLAKVRNVTIYEGDKYLNGESGETAHGIYRIADDMQVEFPLKVSGTPNEVDGDGNPVYQNMSTGADDILWAALSEAAALIEDLETRISSLEEAA